MPISLRREGEARGGNRFAPARFAMPIDDPDPAARARIAGARLQVERVVADLEADDGSMADELLSEGDQA